MISKVEERKCLKEKNGITLIALIITIIVLLILAGVTISMVVGDNGVLTQAQKAKIKTDKAKDQELRGLTAAEAGGNLEMTWYQDGDNKVPIPAGFAVSQVEGENKVDDGLVVIDKNGNEFVWIPCGELNAETEKYDTTKYDEAKDYVTEKWSDKSTGYIEDEKKWTNIDSNEIDNTDIKKQSISNYGGFYVARYEAGVPNNADFYVPLDESAEGKEYVWLIDAGINNKEKNIRNVNTLKPVSKKENQVWNFINQKNAKKVSEAMYEDNQTVDSFLIDSNAWNYICKDIFEGIIGEKGLKDSTKYGNYRDNKTTDYGSIFGLFAKHSWNLSTNPNNWTYSTTYSYGNASSWAPRGKGHNRLELATGASDDFKIYNIYDMAGNMYEWTTETVENSGEGGNPFAVIRGGSFNHAGSGGPVVYSNGDNIDINFNLNIGFRTVLYVK